MNLEKAEFKKDFKFQKKSKKKAVLKNLIKLIFLQNYYKINKVFVKIMKKQKQSKNGSCGRKVM